MIGNYLVLGKLGVGGMGVVFKARHRPSGRVVALKMLPPSFGREAEAVRRFRREFQVASRLNHPNLVAAVEASEDRGVHFMTMEYIPGYDLDRLVANGGPMDLKLALHCAIQAARGLEAAHAQGVIHRDIKPGNIMIDPAGLVRVLDLGLARVIAATGGFDKSAAGTLTQTGSYMGTVDFLAPEQAHDAKSADGRADIYSLGCTLYFLLTGKPPFPGDSVLKRLMAHQGRPAPSLRAARPEVPEALEAVYLRMMAKRPADRPQTISEVLLALEACRTSAREAGDASADLKTFARTALKGPPASDRPNPDASVFARPAPGSGELTFDPKLNLEDLVTDYRDAILHDPIPEEKLPPIAHRPHPPRHRHRGPAASFSLLLPFLAFLALATFILWPRAEPARPPQRPATAAVEVPPTRPTTPTAAAPDAAPANTTLTPPNPAADGRPRILLSDDFSVPHVGWYSSTPEELAKDVNGVHGHGDGHWFLTSRGYDEFAWYIPGGPYPEQESEIAVRVVASEGADPRGGAVVHFIAEVPGGAGRKANRGIQVRINAAGRLMIEPSFLTASAYPNGPWRGPIAHEALRPAGQLNVLKFRVQKHQLEIFANGSRVADPIAFDWDLTPVWLVFGADSWSGSIRAEFDRVEIREYLP